MSDALHIVCPHCDAVNRIPSARLDETPRCGKCHQLLFTGHPVELNASKFRQQITRNDIPVLVDFWAPWCGPCRMVAPGVELATRELAGRLKAVKVNVDEAPGVSARFGVQGIPTLLVLRDGQPVARQVGALPAARPAPLCGATGSWRGWRPSPRPTSGSRSSTWNGRHR